MEKIKESNRITRAKTKISNTTRSNGPSTKAVKSISLTPHDAGKNRVTCFEVQDNEHLIRDFITMPFLVKKKIVIKGSYIIYDTIKSC
jgi:hypothetical protein